MYVAWLILADRILKDAEKREVGNGIQFVAFWGQSKHWSDWRKIWEKEKRMLQKRYRLK